MLFLPADAETIESFIAAAEHAPDELSTIANIMPAPPMPFIPQDAYGKLLIMAMMFYAGPEAVGLRALEPFRAIAKPVADLLRPMRYPEMYPPEEGEYHPTAIGHTMFLNRVDRRTAETIVRYLESSDTPMRVTQLRVLGGAMARVPNDATAFAHRTSRVMANLAAFYEGPEDRAVREAWVADFASALVQGDTGAYVGFLADEGQARVCAAYPGKTWDRLAAIKAQYDPTNLFRLNQNIPPALEKTPSARLASPA
jgi:hypothetical protein